jgi:SH2 domain
MMQALREKNEKILALLEEPKMRTAVLDDVAEFVSSLQLVASTLDGIERAGAPSPSAGLVEEIDSALTAYEKKLKDLKKQNRLVRFLTNNRLRKQLDRLNSRLCLQVKNLEEEVLGQVFAQDRTAPQMPPGPGTVGGQQQYMSPLSGTPAFSSPGANYTGGGALAPSLGATPGYSSNYGPTQTLSSVPAVSQEGFYGPTPTAARMRLSDAVDAQEVGAADWSVMFGPQMTIVPWDDFVDRFRDFADLDQIQEFVLKDILDHANTGSVTRFKFLEFMKGFGRSVANCVDIMMHIYHQEYFHGFVTQLEARRFLEVEPLGTFLVRFSSSRPGSFVIEYVTLAAPAGEDVDEYGVIEDNGPGMGPGAYGLEPKVNSVVLETCESGLRVRTSYSEQVFPTLDDVIGHFAQTFLTPFATNLTKEPWFHGDLSSEEVEELLRGQPVGTFLIRFSSQPGCYASSFVTDRNTIGKSLIKKVPGGYRIEQSANQQVYPLVKELVKDYMRANFFKLPLHLHDHTSVSKKMMIPGARSTPGWVTQVCFWVVFWRMEAHPAGVPCCLLLSATTTTHPFLLFSFSGRAWASRALTLFDQDTIMRIDRQQRAVRAPRQFAPQPPNNPVMRAPALTAPSRAAPKRPPGFHQVAGPGNRPAVNNMRPQVRPQAKTVATVQPGNRYTPGYMTIARASAATRPARLPPVRRREGPRGGQYVGAPARPKMMPASSRSQNLGAPPIRPPNAGVRRPPPPPGQGFDSARNVRARQGAWAAGPPRPPDVGRPPQRPPPPTASQNSGPARGRSSNPYGGFGNFNNVASSPGSTPSSPSPRGFRPKPEPTRDIYGFMPPPQTPQR